MLEFGAGEEEKLSISLTILLKEEWHLPDHHLRVSFKGVQESVEERGILGQLTTYWVLELNRRYQKTLSFIGDCSVLPNHT